MKASLRLTRRLQVVFLVLLGVCTAQLAYWMIDEVRYTESVRSRMLRSFETDIDAARVLHRAGTPWSEIERIYPTLAISADSTTLTVSPQVMASLDAQRFHRLNRYFWEGAFFLTVLIGAMALVLRVLRAEAALRRRQEQFLQGVSHELKSPLASLRLSTETLSLRDPSPDRRAELVRRLLADLGRLERTIANVLDASRLDSEIRTFPSRLTLANAVATVVDEMQEQAVEQQVALSAQVPPDLEINADPEGVRTVLRNLVHNAIRAAHGGRVIVRAAEFDGRVRLDVDDDGLGFPPAEADRLFDKFYRLDGDSRSRMGGTGLGLYLVKRCAQLDGATVSAKSDGPGKGAVFTVAWPKVAVDAPGT